MHANSEGGVYPGVSSDGGVEDAQVGAQDAQDGSPADARLEGEAGNVGDSSCYGPLGMSALFCSGFESPDLSPWVLGGSGGTAGRVTNPTFLGLGALRGASTTTGGSGQLVANVLGGKTSGRLYMRGHVFVPSTTPVSGVTILAYGESKPPYGGVSLVLLPNTGVQVTVNPGSLAVKSATATLERDKWVCVQIDTTISATAGSVTFYVDGKLSGSASNINTLPGRGYEIVAAGIDYTPAAQAPVEAFVDEVAVATSAIPCP